MTKLEKKNMNKKTLKNIYIKEKQAARRMNEYVIRILLSSLKLSSLTLKHSEVTSTLIRVSFIYFFIFSIPSRLEKFPH